MKRTIILLVAVSLFALRLVAQEPLPPESVMRKVAEKLASVSTLGYEYRFEYRYPSQGRSTVVSAEAFLDLKPADGTSRFRFQFKDADGLDAFNGAERFMLDGKSKKLYLESNPTFKSFGNIFLPNSPLSLKYALPRIIADGAVEKKVSTVKIGGRDAYLIEFAIRKGIINSEGEVVEIRPDHTNRYRLTVDKATLLPARVLVSNDKNDETVSVTFSKVTERPGSPPIESWFYSTYQKEYILQRFADLKLIEAGKAAPGFILKEFAGGPDRSFDQFKGKAVLVEFWIAHCGFCIAAVPKLNEIRRKFRDRGLEVVSVNMYDPTATIDNFRRKYKPEYTILTGGESIAPLFGVDEYPAFVLIDRAGVVVYSSSGLDENELERAVAGILKD